MNYSLNLYCVCINYQRSQFIDENSELYVATQSTSIGHNSVLKEGILGDSTQNFSIVNAKEISSSQISLSERNMQDFPEVSEVSIGQISPSKISLQHLGLTKIASTQISGSEFGFLQVGSTEIGTTQVSMREISSPQAALIQFSPTQVSHVQTGVSQVNMTQISSAQISTVHPENNILQVGIPKNYFTQVNSFKIPIAKFHELTSPFYFCVGKISFSSSVPIEQFFKSHYHILPLASIDTYNSNPLNLWQSLFDPTFNISFQITDLPTGQLAEAQITNYDSFGRPNGVESQFLVGWVQAHKRY